MIKATVILIICYSISAAYGTEIFEHQTDDSLSQHDCVTPFQRNQVMQKHAQFLAANPNLFQKNNLHSLSSSSELAAPPLYTFFPQAGQLWSDIYITNFVDLDPSTGVLDYRCGTSTSNNHDGIDCAITSFGKQEIGVPIYAVLDGIVTSLHDGEFDQNTDSQNVPANYIYIAHPDGRSTFYTHMKKNSISVTVGESVVAGQQIGLTGSSGHSSGPHLHMETIENGLRKEPFAGECRPGSSLWAEQPPHDTSLTAIEFTVTTDDLSLWPGAPYETSRTGYLTQGTQRVFFWVKLRNTLTNNVRNTRFLRPNGSVAFDLGTRTFTGPQRVSTRNYNYNIHFDVPGDWTIEYTVNDLVVSAPLTIVPSGSLTPNRNPLPITAQLYPGSPAVDQVVAAQIMNWQVIDDPDYDLLRYRYLWKKDNAVIRDVTTAALSDYVPRTAATAGSHLECTITATDGQGGSTAPVTVSATVGIPSSIGKWKQF